MKYKKVGILAGVPLLCAGVVGATISLSTVSAVPTGMVGDDSTPPKITTLVAPAKGTQAPKGKPYLFDQRLNSSSTVTDAPSSQVAPSPQYFYGGGGQFAVANGAYVNLDVANPYLHSNDAHSLAELAVQSADGKQIVEVGWTKDPAVCGATVPGSSGPCLFTYTWVHGVGKGYNTGFVDYGPTPINVGATMTAYASPARFGILSFDNKWWVSLNPGDGSGGKWIGYFPQTIWSGATPSVTFTKSGLIQAFGEVAAKATGDNTPCSDMGKGILGLNANTTSARISSFTLDTPQPASTLPNLTIGGKSQQYPGKYYTEVLGTPTPGNVRSLRYGGPGWNAAGTGNGVIGGC